jgi:hypothetical protein
MRHGRFLTVVACFSLGACCSTPTVAPDGARLDLVINQLKSDISGIGQFQLKGDAPSDHSCGVHIEAYPQSATITLKTVENVTATGTGTGNIPVSWVIISPTATGSYSDIHTKTITFDTNVDRKTLPAAQTVLPTTNLPATKQLDPAGGQLRDAVVGVLQAFLDADHTARPCFTPKTLKVQADFQVTKKIDGGIQINFIVAKVGGDVALTNDSTQSLLVTMALDGSYGEY